MTWGVVIVIEGNKKAEFELELFRNKKIIYYNTTHMSNVK